MASRRSSGSAMSSPSRGASRDHASSSSASGAGGSRRRSRHCPSSQFSRSRSTSRRARGSRGVSPSTARSRSCSARRSARCSTAFPEASVIESGWSVPARAGFRVGNAPDHLRGRANTGGLVPRAHSRRKSLGQSLVLELDRWGSPLPLAAGQRVVSHPLGVELDEVGAGDRCSAPHDSAVDPAPPPQLSSAEVNGTTRPTTIGCGESGVNVAIASPARSSAMRDWQRPFSATAGARLGGRRDALRWSAIARRRRICRRDAPASPALRARRDVAHDAPTSSRAPAAAELDAWRTRVAPSFRSCRHCAAGLSAPPHAAAQRHLPSKQRARRSTSRGAYASPSPARVSSSRTSIVSLDQRSRMRPRVTGRRVAVNLRRMSDAANSPRALSAALPGTWILRCVRTPKVPWKSGSPRCAAGLLARWPSLSPAGVGGGLDGATRVCERPPWRCVLVDVRCESGGLVVGL